MEEYLFRNLELPDGCFMLWRNTPSVIVGRHQNAYEEVNCEYAERNQINVVRRITGGGAVYHDLGNVNFSFVESITDKAIDFAVYNNKIIAALKRLGIGAELNSRNDIVINGRKFSGSAQSVYRGKVLHHGTLLYDCQLEEMAAVLKVDDGKFQSKGVKSVRARVGNIRDHLESAMSVTEFMAAMVQALTADSPAPEYSLTNQDIANIHTLYHPKYDTWEWNYGVSPPCNLIRARHFPWGKIEMRLNIAQGRIANIKVFGDFFGVEDVLWFEQELLGIAYNPQSVAAALANVSLAEYFGSVARDDILECLFS